VSSVWRRTKDGALPPPVKIGGATRFRRNEVLAAVGGLQPLRQSHAVGSGSVAEADS